MLHSLTALNHLDQAGFVAAIGAVFEETPAIAAAVWHQRPFNTLATLHDALLAELHRFSPSAQLALILAHPDLGSRATMAEASVKEQASRGLDALSPDEYDRFQRLNQAYRDRFGFPFIIAVKHHTKDSILAAFEQRLRHNLETERRQALAEIEAIAWLRLQDWVIEE